MLQGKISMHTDYANFNYANLKIKDGWGRINVGEQGTTTDTDRYIKFTL